MKIKLFPNIEQYFTQESKSKYGSLMWNTIYEQFTLTKDTQKQNSKSQIEDLLKLDTYMCVV